MENNKFNKFYSQKPVIELIEQIRLHRITGNTMDKEWFEALKVHLSQRELTADERRTVDYVLTTDPDSLRNDEMQVKHLSPKISEESSASPISDLAINPTNIINAGKELKAVVYVVLVTIVVILLAGLATTSSEDLDTLKMIYILIGIISLVSNVIIMIKIYSAGDNLENSVLQKRKTQ